MHTHTHRYVCTHHTSLLFPPSADASAGSTKWLLHFPECPHPLPALPCSPLPAETTGLTGSREGRSGLPVGYTCESLSPHIPSLVRSAMPAICIDQVQPGCVEEGRQGQCSSRAIKNIHILWPINSTPGNCFQRNRLKEGKDTWAVYSYVIYNTEKVEANAMTQK